MKLTRQITFLIISICLHIFPQNVNDTLTNIMQRFESFEYEKVISAADSLLRDKDSISRELQIELYRMKGISHFSLLQDRLAENSFTEILKIDSSFNLDPAKTSPKIITFYNEVKEYYKQKIEDLNEVAGRVDTVYVIEQYPDIEIENELKNSIVRSLILPGWGHLYLESSFKGWVLSSLSLLSAASSVYFIFDSKSKEDAYINSNDISLIPGLYDKYNSSYKIRNYSLAAFAAIWLFAQLDLLVFSDISFSNQNSGINLTGTNFNIRLNYNISF